MTQNADSQCKTLKEYSVLSIKLEIDLLYHDLLINVTAFFRDTDAFYF
jgi:chemotaxis methyl-accepting protein methylase